MAPRQTDKRERLIQTAMALVYQQGFHHTTLADIAKQAQVPLGTVYYFFKTKEAIGEALVEHYLRTYREMCQQWDNAPNPKARLQAFIHLMLGDGQRLSQSGCPIGTLCSELHKQGGPLAHHASGIFEEHFLSTLEEVTHDLDIGLVVSNAGTWMLGDFVTLDSRALQQSLRLNVKAHRGRRGRAACVVGTSSDERGESE